MTHVNGYKRKVRRATEAIGLAVHQELKTLIVDQGKAAIEADFAGTHAGAFAEVQPTGREVRVPYAVLYDLLGDQISGLRIYMPMSTLIEQLTR